MATQEAVDELPVVPLAVGEQHAVAASAAAEECGGAVHACGGYDRGGHGLNVHQNQKTSNLLPVSVLDY
jgi:hypothetical protein